jgi:hypothetical protein
MLALKNLVFEDKACTFTKKRKHRRTKNGKAIRSSGAFATGRQQTQSVVAEEQGKVAQMPSSGKEPPPLGTSKPPGMNHLAARTRRAPAEAVEGLLNGG